MSEPMTDAEIGAMRERWRGRIEASQADAVRDVHRALDEVERLKQVPPWRTGDVMERTPEGTWRKVEG